MLARWPECTSEEARDLSEQIGLVAASLGIAWVIASSSPPLLQNVVLRPVTDLMIELDTHLMWRRERLGATGRAFIAALREFMAARRDDG